ncbi:MAG: GNAT family N-acetyltransferase [Gammaproteobacteria bacterium]|nr:GNAT family N-acetyltransferase [Gammaproteobacteria bacterium]
MNKSGSRPLFMRNGLAYEIHSCLDPDLSFTPERWKQEIRKGLARLSAKSRWQRFASGVNQLSEDQLDYLTDVDGKDRVAWCALIRSGDSYQGIGVSRYVRLPGEGACAEFAVTVIDEYQKQGIGRALLERLLESARCNGISTLRGFVFPSNLLMLELCRQLHAHAIPVESFIQVDIPVPSTDGFNGQID